MSYYSFFSRIYEMGAEQMCRDCQDFIKRGSKILDLGCGSGIAAKKFQDFFESEVLGVDIRDNRTVDIPFKIIDGKTLPFDEDAFDVTLIAYVLHHCKAPEILLTEAKRVSQKIIIFEDIPEGILSKLRCKLHQLTFFGGKRGKFSFKTREEWKELFQKLGLKVVAENWVSTKLDWLDPGKRALFFLEK